MGMGAGGATLWRPMNGVAIAQADEMEREREVEALKQTERRTERTSRRVHRDRTAVCVDAGPYCVMNFAWCVCGESSPYSPCAGAPRV
jgi:hypothetical protein